MNIGDVIMYAGRLVFIVDKFRIKYLKIKLLKFLLLMICFYPMNNCFHKKCEGAKRQKKPFFKLAECGTEKIVKYEKYGEFENVGTFDYRFVIKDEKGLARAVGEGIFPNLESVIKDKLYKKLRKEGRLKGSHWDHVATSDSAADFFVWATANENPGVKLFFTAKALENAGLYLQAIKAYRAAMIFFPRSMCWSREGLWAWFIAPAAWSAIINLTRMHPELEMELVDAYVKIEKSVDGDPHKTRIAVTPGQLIRCKNGSNKKGRSDSNKFKIIQRRGGKVNCIQYENGHWEFQVNGKPFFVRGVQYSPTKVGKDYQWNWMKADENSNGLVDTAYETWVDKNRNNKKDKNEKIVGDFKLLKEMGCNAIRLFNNTILNKELLRDMYNTYGIGVFLCDPFGAYTVHSGADWEEGTDYSDYQQCEKMKEAVYQTVIECREEPWLLGYILGNENNMSSDYTGVNATRTKASLQPEIYAKFLNEVAKMIHKLDPEHPVGVGNVGLGLVETYAVYAPELDFIGINEYSGANGFGTLWIKASKLINRPILITEFGCDAYATGKGMDENAQAKYHHNCWKDILYNSQGKPGEGNAIGGIVFEWLDEWWKDSCGDPLDIQNNEPTCEMAFPDGWSQEEWLGIVGQGDGKNSPFLRDLRQSYFVYKQLWK